MSDRPPHELTWAEELTWLIQHGRDREAAELAAHHQAPLAQGGLTDPRNQLDEMLPLQNELVDPPVGASPPVQLAAFTGRQV